VAERSALSAASHRMRGAAADSAKLSQPVAHSWFSSAPSASLRLCGERSAVKLYFFPLR